MGREECQINVGRSGVTVDFAACLHHQLSVKANKHQPPLHTDTANQQHVKEACTWLSISPFGIARR